MKDLGNSIRARKIKNDNGSRAKRDLIAGSEDGRDHKYGNTD